MATSDYSTEILHDFYPVQVRVYKDGRVERLLSDELCPPSLNDPDTGVQSKDVVISPENNVSARLFLPPNAAPGKKIPLLFYTHGGGFMIGSAFSKYYHRHLNSIVAKANVVAVSVEYRLAPEFPVPTCYEDSWLALKWVASQFTTDGGESWIKEYADSDRVFIGGDSAGGNIAHNVTMRIGSEKLDGIHVRGLFLDCPFFWGEVPMGKEATLVPKRCEPELWRFVCPGATGCDDPRINPAMDPKLSSIGCKKVLIFAGEKDFLRDRDWYYKETLSKSSWDGDIEIVEAEGEEHVWSVCRPDCENTKEFLKKVAAFLNQ